MNQKVHFPESQKKTKQTSLNSATWVWENIEKTLEPDRLAALLDDPEVDVLVDGFFTGSGAGAGAGASGSGSGAASSFFLVFLAFFSLSAWKNHSLLRHEKLMSSRSYSKWQSHNAISVQTCDKKVGIHEWRHSKLCLGGIKNSIRNNASFESLFRGQHSVRLPKSYTKIALKLYFSLSDFSAFQDNEKFHSRFDHFCETRPAGKRIHKTSNCPSLIIYCAHAYTLEINEQAMSGWKFVLQTKKNLT